MSSALPYHAEVPTGAYAERLDRRRGQLDRLAAVAAGPIRRWWQRRACHPRRLLEAAAEHGRQLVGARDTALGVAAAELRTELRVHGFRDDLVARAFAVVREAASRRLGQRPFDVQLVGARVLLGGMVAEMETGEGKTLTATLPACTAALAGVPVHVVTVNDYLARRDAEWMGPIYEALGLSVGVIVHGMEPEARREAYGCDVTYCTNKELAFDYLKDRIALRDQPSRVRLQLERLYGDARPRRLLLRGLHYAIVDEADSVLVDEARTPLIISGGGADAGLRREYERALALADALTAEADFIVEPGQRAVRLTDAGRSHLAEIAEPLGGLWTGRLRREEMVRQALSARHLFHRDRDYLVAADKVQIIDEYTGRLMPDRSWEHGLHQLIEVKEGCTVTGRNDPLARISYQRFFRRYGRLAGMTGTAREIAGELWSVYGLGVVSIPTNAPLRRRYRPDQVYSSAEARWQAVVARVQSVNRRGRPVLLGTRSVAASEHLSRLLSDAGLPHRVLNARQDREEAAIIADAGTAGQITVATNMAGRGTDIRLGLGVADRGGLHVIATERHEARRIDRQLFGRCGRQGDPGSYEALTSVEDELVITYGRRWARVARLLTRGDRVPAWIGRVTLRRAQRAAELTHARMRGDLLRMDEHLESALAFSGRPE